jgi:hypothetical protein
MNQDNYDELRRFQRIPVQRPLKAKDKAQQALEQGQCMRIPRNVVREAREIDEEQISTNPLIVVKQFVTNLLR